MFTKEYLCVHPNGFDNRMYTLFLYHFKTTFSLSMNYTLYW